MGQCFLYGNGSSAGWRVAVGLTEPGAPRENMLWVKSDRAGGKYVFAETEPENPPEGLIWFRVSSMGIITRADVYADGAWAAADAYMYLTGSWVRIAAALVYLIRGGDQCANVTGGWKGVRYYWSASLPGGVPHVTWAEDGVSVTASGTAAGSLLVTEKPIDVTQYGALLIQCESASDQVMCQLSTDTGDLFKAGQAASVSLTAGTASLDLSALSGQYYVGIQPRAQKKAKIRQILLK